MYNIRNDATRWPISTSMKVVLEHFSLAFTFFKILNIYCKKFCDHENICQYHDVRHSQWRHSVAISTSIWSYENIMHFTHIFCLYLNVTNQNLLFSFPIMQPKLEQGGYSDSRGQSLEIVIFLGWPTSSQLNSITRPYTVLDKAKIKTHQEMAFQANHWSQVRAPSPWEDLEVE